jgi:hypothetical protein
MDTPTTAPINLESAAASAVNAETEQVCHRLFSARETAVLTSWVS